MASRDYLIKRRVNEPFEVGKIALDESRFEEAVTQFRLALRLGAASTDEEALIRCSLSEALEKRGLYREQLEAVNKYAKLAEFTRLTEATQLRVLIRLGWGHSVNDDTPRAIAFFNQALDIAKKLDDSAASGACFFGLGRAYRHLTEVRIARDYYQAALEHYRKAGNWRQLAESYINLGYITAYDSDYRSSQNSLKQALAIIGQREEHGLLGRAYMYLAVVYDNLGSTTNAIATWEKAIEHFRRAGNAYHLATNQNNLAEKLMWLGYWDRAEELIQSAIDYFVKAPTAGEYAGSLDTLAQLYLLRGKIEEADHLLNQSLEILAPIKGGEWGLLSTWVTIGRSFVQKEQPEEAIPYFEKVIEVSERTGDHRYVAQAKLCLAEVLLEKADIGRASQLVNEVESFLRDSPTMPGWGLLMRGISKVEFAKGHIAAAIQSLKQSSSIFEIHGSAFETAINKISLAQMFAKLGEPQTAIRKIEEGLATFEQLGAALNAQRSREYLEALHRSVPAAAAAVPIAAATSSSSENLSSKAVPDLASAMDGFMAQRLVRASVMRGLLIYELASIIYEQAQSRAVLITEFSNEESAAQKSQMAVAVALGLDERQQHQELEFLKKLPATEYAQNYVFQFTDNHRTAFLLRIIDPKSERFLERQVNLEPLISLVEQGLEVEFVKGKTRRAQVFNPARFLSRVEMPGFLCASRAMAKVLEQIDKIRSSDVTVLITGESGTGKELIARAVHAGSSRRFNQFTPFNCSAAPREMVESQLFGYRRGAFTGAVESNKGIIRTADNGTLFLDEIGDLPIELQPKLLRFLQEGEIFPIGDNQPSLVDVRVIAATNAQLENAVAEGRFREDLFHRLNVIRIQVPPLRERREEIPILMNYYLNLYQKESAKRDIKLSEETVDLMVVYDWPGNVRQLCNEVRRIVAYSESGTLVEPDSLSQNIVQASRDIQLPETAAKPRAELFEPTPSGVTLSEAVEELERRMIRDALHRHTGNIARASRELGLSRKGLYLKMDRLNFKSGDS